MWLRHYWRTFRSWRYVELSVIRSPEDLVLTQILASHRPRRPIMQHDLAPICTHSPPLQRNILPTCLFCGVITGFCDLIQRPSHRFVFCTHKMRRARIMGCSCVDLVLQYAYLLPSPLIYGQFSQLTVHLGVGIQPARGFNLTDWAACISMRLKVCDRCPGEGYFE